MKDTVHIQMESTTHFKLDFCEHLCYNNLAFRTETRIKP